MKVSCWLVLLKAIVRRNGPWNHTCKCHSRRIGCQLCCKSVLIKWFNHQIARLANRLADRIWARTAAFCHQFVSDTMSKRICLLFVVENPELTSKGGTWPLSFGPAELANVAYLKRKISRPSHSEKQPMQDV